MYESITYEMILQRMLSRIPDGIDKREGSIIYDALAPAAIEMKNMYIELDAIYNETFADTASRTYLIRRAAERGIIPKPASKAILQGAFSPTSIAIPIGSRFSASALNYIVKDKISTGVYKLECESLGAVGNQYFGDIIPVDYIDGLEVAQLTELLIPGEDEEETESLRKRYYDSLEAQAFGGNIADYKDKTKAISGVGGVKVYPTWDGGGTVKLVIIDSQFKAPTETLISNVQTILDPMQNQGIGLGLAPIGHAVTAVGVSYATIDVATTIVYQDGWLWEDTKVNVESAIDSYFLELSEQWENSDNLVIRISQIETRLLNCPGILDVSGTTFNGTAQNITLDADVIPTRGVVNG